MTPDDAADRLNEVLAHLWMIRTFLKHADEIQEDEVLLDVPRTLFDSIRAAEPARERGDTTEFLRRVKGKLPKIRRVAELFQSEHRRVSDHTNFQMCAASLTACVRRMDEIVTALKSPADSRPEATAPPVGTQLPPNPT